MAKQKITRVAQLKSAADFMNHQSVIATELPFKAHLSDPRQSSLARTFQLKSGQTIGNRFCILPMEGWDATATGIPTELTRRRWHNFAISGAKLLWGCEAVAVCPHTLGITCSGIDDFFLYN